MLIHRAVERGLAVADLEDMTIGMVLDYLVGCKNEELEAEAMRKNGTVRYATQEDIDAF